MRNRTHTLRLLFKKLILFLLINLTLVISDPLSEKDIIELTLKQNSNIQISRLNIRSDILDLKSTEASSLPQISALTGVNYLPLDSTVVTSVIGDSTYRTVSSQLQLEMYSSISASQAIPGGGVIGGSLEGSRQYTDSSNNSNNIKSSSTNVNINFSQPLLKDAWRHAEPYFSISIKRLDSKQFTLEQKKMILASISEARLAFWDLYEKQKLLTLYNNELNFKEKMKVNALQRFSIGEGSVIDTLSATHEYWEVYQLLLSAKAEIEVARNNLADILIMDSKTIGVGTHLEMELMTPPDENKILRAAKEFDPEINIFKIMKEKLILQLKNDKNQLLPDLRFETSYNRNSVGNSFFESDHYLSTNLAIGLILRYDFPIRTKKMAVEKSELSIKKTKLFEEQYDRKLESKIAELVLRWNQELESLRVSRLSQNIVKQQVEASRTGYEIGTVDRLSLLKAENDFLHASVRVIQKELALKKLEILFEETTGIFLSKYGVELK